MNPNSHMKIKPLLAFALCASVMPGACAQSAPETASPKAVKPAPSDVLATLKPTHPRLMASDDTWAQIKAQRATDAELDAFLTRQEREARALFRVEPIAYKKTGIRLLAVSRTVLTRTILLSMQYRLTDDKKFLKRAQVEMLNAASFKDWNPDHFLDTAEMTAALAIGYDWLYADLDKPARKTIATAIRDKGLNAGLEYDSWVKKTNNWNSVCHAGMVMGALALAEDEPKLAKHYVNQARAFNPLVMEAYAPDGIYPEGLNYWTYGTTYEVMLIDSLQSALGRDFGLSQSPGFMESARALFYLVGPSGLAYNYFDGSDRAKFNGTTLWFARELKQPAIARLESAGLQEFQERTTNPKSNYLHTLHLVPLWWTAKPDKPVDWPLNWMGDGPNPLAAFRSDWDDSGAMWLALKGGRAGESHGHMDAGSFVFESDGVRWARDLGAQSYESLESQKVDMWKFDQNSERWGVFRLGPFSHNTLTINGQLHDVDGNARITRFGDGASAGAVVDLSPVFQGQATRVTRGFLFRPGQDTTIRDELQGLKAGDTVRFAMVIEAAVAIADDGQSATLTSDGKKLTMKLAAGAQSKWQVIDAKGAQTYDEANPNTRLLIANFSAPASGDLSWAVTLVPGSAQAGVVNPLAQTAIADWPLARVGKTE